MQQRSLCDTVDTKQHDSVNWYGHGVEIFPVPVVTFLQLISTSIQPRTQKTPETRTIPMDDIDVEEPAVRERFFVEHVKKGQSNHLHLSTTRRGRPIFKFALILTLCSHILGEHVVVYLNELDIGCGFSLRLRASYRKLLLTSERKNICAEDIMEDFNTISSIL